MSTHMETKEIKTEDIKEQSILLTMTDTGDSKNKLGNLNISITGLTTAQLLYASLALFEQTLKRFDSVTAAEFVANKVRLVSDLIDKMEGDIKEKKDETDGGVQM